MGSEGGAPVSDPATWGLPYRKPRRVGDRRSVQGHTRRVHQCWELSPNEGERGRRPAEGVVMVPMRDSEFVKIALVSADFPLPPRPLLTTRIPATGTGEMHEK